jgi:serine/threonine protein kinase
MTQIRQYDVGDEPVPGYRLTGFLGSGGFGEVWKATAPGGTQVAIKIINLAMKGALKEFRSLRLVKRIQYPNLVPILAIWLKDPKGEILEESAFEEIAAQPSQLRGTLAAQTLAITRQSEPAELIIAMGLGHKSLADRLEECQRQGLTGIPVDELLKYLQDAARAIDYLNSPRHDLGSDATAIQHCDIKPPNILIVGDAAQVCDFSLARAVDDLRKTSLSFSPVYAAPEVIESNTPSPSTDQYSLAVSYVELRTGELPFPSTATAHVVVQAHLNGNLDLSRLPPAERAVIRRGTAREPSARFASASDLMLALRQACHPQSGAPRRQTLLRWTAASLVVALALVSSALWLHWHAGPRPLQLPSGFAAAPGAKIVKLHERNCPDQIISTRHGLNIPFRLVDSRRTGVFYIMENKVSNEQFARFASENPQVVQNSKWELGASAQKQNLGAAGHERLPVFRVTCVEAALFARWLGGDLPTAERWDAAAGRYEPPPDGEASADRGPFRQPWDPDQPRELQVAVNRGLEGPLPVGTATHDISTPFGCRDMAGNGNEWTGSPRDALERFDPDNPDPLLSIILRGRSYMQPEPLRFKDLDDRLLDEDQKCVDSNLDISFRVAVVFDDLP